MNDTKRKISDETDQNTYSKFLWMLRCRLVAVC